MPDEFQYDVFLSHSAKDNAVLRAVAKRLRADGLQVWFDEWVLAKAKGEKRKSASELHPSAFILQPFLDAPIKGSLAQFLCINWRSKPPSQASSKTESALDRRLSLSFNPTELCE
jgi:hypothetical protein